MPLTLTHAVSLAGVGGQVGTRDGAQRNAGVGERRVSVAGGGSMGQTASVRTHTSMERRVEAFGTGEKGKRSGARRFVDEVRERGEREETREMGSEYGVNERASERPDIRLCG